MLKWTVNPKKNNGEEETPAAADPLRHLSPCQYTTTNGTAVRNSTKEAAMARRSLDASEKPQVAASRKFRRRSLGAQRIVLKKINRDKENVCKSSSTPIYYRDNNKNDVLKDVSNLNANTPPTALDDKTYLKRRRLILEDSPIENRVKLKPKTIHPNGTNLFEIEYSPNRIVDLEQKSTLPIFGSGIFMENPLYFNIKAKRLKLENQVSVTPISKKLDSLSFGKMSYHQKIKDEEVSMEMENKCIKEDKIGSVMTDYTESTVSDSQMGDETLERMIEDIIHSVKRVKNKRKAPPKEPETEIQIIEPIAESQSNEPNAEVIEPLNVSEKSYILNESTEINEREVKTPILREFKRQRCVRRKRSVRTAQEGPKESALLLKTGIPSPESISQLNNLDMLSSSFNCIVGIPFKSDLSLSSIETASPTPTPWFENSTRFPAFSPYEPDCSSAEKRRSVASGKSGRGSGRQFSKGTITLRIHREERRIRVHVIKCDDLQYGRKDCEINAYVKVAISADSTDLTRRPPPFKRTPVFRSCSSPTFDRELILPHSGDEGYIQVSVWHRDRLYRRSVFLGCMSVSVKDAEACESSGTFRLSASARPGSTAPPHHLHQHSSAKEGSSSPRLLARANSAAATDSPKTGSICSQVITAEINMAADAGPSTSRDGPLASDDFGMDAVPSTSTADVNKLSSSGQQKTLMQQEADEHQFLRYLELDPLEGPDAGPAAVQRRASANKSGRTPFTATRRLACDSTGGFGFTVVWTKPPRVERVTPGGPAERAGIRPGDYIVFVANTNIVMCAENEVRQLIRSSGTSLILELFRRASHNGLLSAQMSANNRGSIASHVTISDSSLPPLKSTSFNFQGSKAEEARTEMTANQGLTAPVGLFRPSTACSGATTTQSLDIVNSQTAVGSGSRRRLNLPQVTFSKESTSMGQEELKKKAYFQLISREQQYATCLQFGIDRYIIPLADKADIITPNDHQILFQNIEELLRLTEDILDQVVQEDGEIQVHLIPTAYLTRVPTFVNIYKRYCLGLKRADCVLVKKSRDPSGAFVKFCNVPPIPRRRPDVTSLVHKPLEQFREILRLLRAALHASGGSVGSGMNLASGINSNANALYERKQLQTVTDQLQTAYREVTAGSGLMGPSGEGKPLLSVSDLESRLVFTRCKPFVLATPGRQWIFGGELSRVEGRTVRPYWALLFSDLLLFAKVSRDRVLFITEEPLALTNVTEACFNVRKKAVEFRLLMGRNGAAESPTVHCAPHHLPRPRFITLRAPSIDLKAVWQNLLQRQIYRVHTMSGTPLGSPMDSPDPQTTFSLATIDSQQRQPSLDCQEALARRCAEQAVRSGTPKGAALHLAQWMRHHPEPDSLVEEPVEETMTETWSIDELRKRTKELHLEPKNVPQEENIKPTPSPEVPHSQQNSVKHHAAAENGRSPSKSSNSDSQVTVRSSPVVMEQKTICRQCHNKCLSKPNSPLVSQKDSPPKDNNTNNNKLVPKSNELPKFQSCNTCTGEPTSSAKSPTSTASSTSRKSLSKEEAKRQFLSSVKGSPSPKIRMGVSSTPRKLQSSSMRASPVSQRSASPCVSRNTNSPSSTSRTTISSAVFNTSTSDLRNSPQRSYSNDNPVQCVIAQEKVINEVMCVENVILSKNCQRELSTESKAESVLSQVFGMNIITKRSKLASCSKTSAVFLDNENEGDTVVTSSHRSRMYGDYNLENGFASSDKISNYSSTTSSIRNGIVNEGCDEMGMDEEMEWGGLMLMGLSAINPAAHLMKIDPFSDNQFGELGKYSKSPNHDRIQPNKLPNISIVPATPDYKMTDNRLNHEILDDSPEDSPQPEDPPYLSLKRYGTLSSLERIPSDETDDGNFVSATESETIQPVDTSSILSQTQSLMGWTARAGSYVAGKVFGTTIESDTVKQPSFIERYLRVSDWRTAAPSSDPVRSDDSGGGYDIGEGSAASGEEAWGTPSSGELSDNNFADSDHGTASSPTKSTSSYAGDDDTELMMDELLMAPPIAGPALRPLLPRRRLEPLLEEEYSDSDTASTGEGAAPNTSPTSPNKQGRAALGDVADDWRGGPFAAAVLRPVPASAFGLPHTPYATDVVKATASPLPHRPVRPRPVTEEEWLTALQSSPLAKQRGRQRKPPQQPRLEDSPDRTPTNEDPLPKSLLELKSLRERALELENGVTSAFSQERVEVPLLGPIEQIRAREEAALEVQEKTSGESTPSQCTTIESIDAEGIGKVTPPEERLSPRMEMRLALQEGRDILAEQDQLWGQLYDHWSWNAAARRSLGWSATAASTLRPPRTHPAPPQHRPPYHLSHHSLAPDTRIGESTTITSSSSAYALKGTTMSMMEMERLASAEAQSMRSRPPTRQPQNGKILGFLRRRASSDSPLRRRPPQLSAAPQLSAQRPYSPRRQNDTDKQLERRFWKQVIKRRSSCSSIPQIPV